MFGEHKILEHHFIRVYMHFALPTREVLEWSLPECESIRSLSLTECELFYARDSDTKIFRTLLLPQEYCKAEVAKETETAPSLTVTQLPFTFEDGQPEVYVAPKM